MVSIVIPCYNDVEYIKQAVDSALSQTYSNIEIIVVDDGSNAKTKTALKQLEPQITKLISQKNKGVSAARNVGIKQAIGDYILVLDSDDFFEAEFCEKAVSVFEKNKNVEIVTCHVNRIKNNKAVDVFIPHGGDIEDFLKSNGATGSSMFRKSGWEETGGYDENMIKGFEDWEFFIRLLKKGGIVYVIPKILFNYRIRLNSRTTGANKVKYKLLKYIYIKHKDLYISFFESFMDYLLSRIEREEQEKIKNLNRVEFKIGKKLLAPFRKLKKIIQ